MKRNRPNVTRFVSRKLAIRWRSRHTKPSSLAFCATQNRICRRSSALSQAKYYLEGVILPNSFVGFPGFGRGDRIHIQLLAKILVSTVHRVLGVVRLPHPSAPSPARWEIRRDNAGKTLLHRHTKTSLPYNGVVAEAWRETTRAPTYLPCWRET